MCKRLFLIIILAFFTMVLSSCTLNIFKEIDESQSAFSAYKNGDFEKAITLAAISFAKISNGSFNSEGFYNAVITSDSKMDSRDKLASLSNFLNATSSTDVALSLDSEAMLESISEVMKLNLLSIERILFSTSITSSPDVNVNIIKGLDTILFLSHNIQLMDLMESLSMTLHRYKPSNPNWLLSIGIYSFLKVPILLFDSNDDDVLGTEDAIYSYLWNSSANTFKKDITSQDYNHILNDVVLGTYKDVQKSSLVIKNLSLSVSAFNNALNEMVSSSTQSTDFIKSLRRYVGQIELAMYFVDANKFSQAKHLGDLIQSLFGNS